MKEDKETQKRVDYLINKMSRFLGARIPRREYPLVILTKGNSYYNADLNYFNIRESDKYSGEVLGHELGGFFREKLKQQKKQEPLTTKERIKSFLGYNPKEAYETEEIHAHEFFDYLGTRILKELVNGKEAVRFGEKREPIEQTREYKLHHTRPSRFARQVDLSKITDYKALFSLPDKEVRYRFFRTDPQYDLTKPIQPGKITIRQSSVFRQSSDLKKSEPITQTEPTTQSALETALKFIGTSGILLLAIFSINIKNLTGRVIDIQNPVELDYILIILFIIIVILIIMILINKLKRGKR